MKIQKILRNAVAGAMIAAVPVSASYAATRPNAAVPVAVSGAASTAAVQDDGYDSGTPWLAIGAVAVAVLVAIWILVDDDDGEGALTDG